jgi:tRNA1(Val) A37 N6-methylase TrmN6
MKVAIWISKEKLLPAQEKLLKDAGYNIIVYNKGIYNVEDFLNEIKNLSHEMYERVLLIPVVPESVKMRLLEEIKNRGLKFEVVEPLMKELGRYDNEVLCKMLLSQNLDSRVVVKLKDGTCKVYEFVEFKRLVEYVKRYDEEWSL